MSDPPKSFGNWMQKGFLAVGDQAITTGINFFLGILLARWLSPEDYGAYAVAYAYFLLLSIAYQSLLLEPMSVFGASVYSGQTRQYLGNLLILHFIVSLSVFVVLAIAGWFALSFAELQTLPSGLVGVAIAAPCILLLWLTRNAYYMKLAPWPAVLGSAGYAAILTGSGIVAFLNHLISPFFAFALMGMSAFFVGVIQLTGLRPIVVFNSSALQQVASEHWVYGRWILAGSLLVWVTSNIYFVVFSSSAGLAQAGELKALLNLTLPIGQTATAMSLLLQPYAARIQYSERGHSIGNLVHRITLIYVAASTMYWILVMILRRPLFEVLYGPRYTNVMDLVPLVAMSSVLAVAAHGPGIGLRAVRSPASVFVAFCGPSVISLAVGIPATLKFGIRGTLVTLILANAVALITAYILLRRRTHLDEMPPAVFPDTHFPSCAHDSV